MTAANHTAPRASANAPLGPDPPRVALSPSHSGDKQWSHSQATEVRRGAAARSERCPSYSGNSGVDFHPSPLGLAPTWYYSRHTCGSRFACTESQLYGPAYDSRFLSRQLPTRPSDCSGCSSKKNEPACPRGCGLEWLLHLCARVLGRQRTPMRWSLNERAAQKEAESGRGCED